MPRAITLNKKDTTSVLITFNGIEKLLSFSQFTIDKSIASNSISVSLKCPGERYDMEIRENDDVYLVLEGWGDAGAYTGDIDVLIQRLNDFFQLSPNTNSEEQEEVQPQGDNGNVQFNYNSSFDGLKKSFLRNLDDEGVMALGYNNIVDAPSTARLAVKGMPTGETTGNERMTVGFGGFADESGLSNATNGPFETTGWEVVDNKLRFHGDGFPTVLISTDIPWNGSENGKLFKVVVTCVDEDDLIIENPELTIGIGNQATYVPVIDSGTYVYPAVSTNGYLRVTASESFVGKSISGISILEAEIGTSIKLDSPMDSNGQPIKNLPAEPVDDGDAISYGWITTFLFGLFAQVYPSKHFFGSITQTDEDDPVVDKFRGNFNTITWARTDIGIFEGTSSNSFRNDGDQKMFFAPQRALLGLDGAQVVITRVDQHTVRIESFDANGNHADGLLTNFNFEMRRYDPL